MHQWYDGVTDVLIKVTLDVRCHSLGGHFSTADETTESRLVQRLQVLNPIASPVIRYLHDEGGVTAMSNVTQPEFCIQMQRQLTDRLDNSGTPNQSACNRLSQKYW